MVINRLLNGMILQVDPITFGPSNPRLVGLFPPLLPGALAVEGLRVWGSQIDPIHLGCWYMGVSLKGGTPISHLKMIIFSRKTHGGWGKPSILGNPHIVHENRQPIFGTRLFWGFKFHPQKPLLVIFLIKTAIGHLGSRYVYRIFFDFLMVNVPICKYSIPIECFGTGSEGFAELFSSQPDLGEHILGSMFICSELSLKWWGSHQ